MVQINLFDAKVIKSFEFNYPYKWIVVVKGSK